MRVSVLGSGDAFSGCGCNAAYAVDGRILVDCGAPVHVLLERAGLRVGDVEAVLVTHFHGDHTLMLPVLLGALLAARAPTGGVVIAGPVGTREYVERLVGDCYGLMFLDLIRDRVAPAYRVLQDGADEVIAGHRVRAHAVVHSTGPSLAYAVSDEAGTTAGFSGDTILCAGLRRLAAQADLLVCECTSWDEPIPSHMWRGDVERLMAEHPGTRLLLSHLTRRDSLPGALVAHDLLTLDVEPRQRG